MAWSTNKHDLRDATRAQKASAAAKLPRPSKSEAKAIAQTGVWKRQGGYSKN